MYQVWCLLVSSFLDFTCPCVLTQNRLQLLFTSLSINPAFRQELIYLLVVFSTNIRFIYPYYTRENVLQYNHVYPASSMNQYESSHYYSIMFGSLIWEQWFTPRFQCWTIPIHWKLNIVIQHVLVSRCNRLALKGRLVHRVMKVW